LLSWKHSLASGLRETEKGATLATTPASTYNTNIVQRVGQLTVDPAGAVTGTVRFVMSGPDALRWRQLALENDQDEVKKQFNESVKDEVPDGAQAEFDHFIGLTDYDTNLIAVVNVTGNIGTSTGKHFFLPGFFFQSRAKLPFVAQDSRTTPVDVHYAKMEQDDITYHLPAGLTVESAPQAANAGWPSHAMLKTASKATGDDVNVTRTLAYNFTLLDPKEYHDLHDFYQKVATADQQQLVLTHAQVAKGN
jgi:hypothetical protein